MPKCKAVCPPPSAAQGGECLLDDGHTGPHETHGIMVTSFEVRNGMYVNPKIVCDGAANFKWEDE
jgi:hypothetical protein